LREKFGHSRRPMQGDAFLIAICGALHTPARMCHLHAVEDIRRFTIESRMVAESLLRAFHE
jgi:hypothetical protein